jgi:hypothetical protein
LKVKKWKRGKQKRVDSKMPFNQSMVSTIFYFTIFS